jgi:putative ATPase
MFIARRIVILAGEDVGLADPQALVIASAAQQATHLIGFPEAWFPLAEATVYLALAPKSDSLKRGVGELQKDLDETRADPVPLHLRNAPTPLMKQLGYGKDYKYAHDYEDHVAPDETYLPDNLRGRRYYVPTELGAEAELKRRLEAVRRRATAAVQARTAGTSGSRPNTG